jgi:hypothetical protein
MPVIKQKLIKYKKERREQKSDKAHEDEAMGHKMMIMATQQKSCALGHCSERNHSTRQATYM